MADRKKEGKAKIQKFEYHENEKKLKEINKIKSIFDDHKRAIIWWKKWKIADVYKL